MRHTPRVIVGAIQFTPEDPLPTPFIAVSYPSREEAKSVAGLVLSLQNGTRPLESGPQHVYVGDTKVKVRVRPAEKNLLMELFAYAEPSHLTASFYAASRVDRDLYKAFRRLVEILKTYTFTVAAGDEIMTEELDLVKYILDEKEVGY